MNEEEEYSKQREKQSREKIVVMKE